MVRNSIGHVPEAAALFYDELANIIEKKELDPKIEVRCIGNASLYSENVPFWEFPVILRISRYFENFLLFWEFFVNLIIFRYSENFSLFWEFSEKR